MKRIILLLSLSCGQALASDNCGALLQDGIFNRYFDRSDYSLIHEAKSTICTQYTRNQQDGTDIGVDLGAIGISFSGSEVNSYGYVYCEDNYEFTEQTANNVHLAQMASNDVIQGYLACIEASSLGVNYDVSYQGAYSTSARIDVNVSQLANTRLPVFNGIYTYPSGAVSCEFISAASPLPGENLTPGYYTVQCNQDDTMVDAYITLAFDTVSALSVPFSGKGDLKSNEYWELQGTIANSVETQNDRRRTWEGVTPISLIDIGDIETTATCVDLPTEVPDDAREMALFIQVTTTTQADEKPITFDIYTNDYDKTYTQNFFVEGGGGSGQTRFYNSDNLWLPITSDRQVCTKASDDIRRDREFEGSLQVTGYRL
ncbi:MAG: hypothetical protein KBT87_04200 [Gammaproteobacteria bacterium]|nr:hypothetical protein [Gammaproteobacteria bacterium]MBQ0773855.1 hypothetical protein [Gammaproteobacteria bacterium]